ncbi:hypothetical protein OEZ85_000508 [Tetradesmus obliquus]|uniref:DUF4042 domain-containing protein n=1 Tax=Tetradesmus obliquus TaxID=3088 RepID=A0ABY8UJH1_TETOB|nr:hypothetical protein OEZ85_000508 [Tetradesmus obliquus]
MNDPCNKVRLLAAALLVALLEGPAARALLAVAEARSAPKAAVRGFTTVSTSLGHMLLALHAGLLAAVQGARPAQQQQQGQQQQQQEILVPSVGQLQSCLASRSPKVVWNAAYAAAGLLQNSCLHPRPEVTAAIPSLLLVLIVLVRDSSNLKIKTHAAAALAAVGSRQGYGECFADAVLVLLAALDALEGNSSSSSSSAEASSGGPAAAAAAAAAGADDDGSFPNFRYIPGLAAQLQTSLLHLLSLLQQSSSRACLQ